MIAKNRIVVAAVSLTLLLVGCQQEVPAPAPEKAQAESPADNQGASTPAEPVADAPQMGSQGTADGSAPIAEQGAEEQKTPSPEQPDKLDRGADMARRPDGPVNNPAARVMDSFAEPAAAPEEMAGPKSERKLKLLVADKSMLNIVGGSDLGTASSPASASLSAIGGNMAGGGGFAGMDAGLGRARGLQWEGHNSADRKEVPGTESYQKMAENQFKLALENPLSTLSIDVDTASYTNARRFIDTMSRLPPQDSVRVEEFINYFTYDYPAPTGETPFSVTTEVSACPWNPENRMVLVGIQGKKPPEEDLPPSNLVFLIDSSGSMSSEYKMPLLKMGFQMLVRQLSEKDRVAIVVYAGSAGLVLPSTSGTDKDTIQGALDRLRAGGSTAGAAGIQLAYQVAKDNLIKGGNNRVILATDGDFNVGAASNSELERIIEEKRNDGIFLTVLGFGMGNYKDARMETLADKGNGNYAYIDNILEAKKVFVTQMTGTLFTIAKDVKIQVEFNPAKVKSYRLVGYENRILAKEDFADDTKDAGELGAGHTVTALYEVVPAEDGATGIDELRYVKTAVKESAASSSELMTIKLRYKLPDGDVSTKLEQPVLDQRIALDKTSNNYRFAASVAMFGMLLHNSTFVGNTTYGKVMELARTARGEDSHGYRAEFIKLVEKADLLAPSKD